METIKSIIIKYVEGQGKASKTQICDHLRETVGTTGDCVSRRMRELVSAGVFRKVQKEYNGKKYYEYSVVEEETQEDKLQAQAYIESLPL